MEGLIMAAQLLAGLSILVGIHEFGHFFAAKIFKIKVNKFYLFFDFLFPFPNLLKFSIFKIKRGDTEYGLGWFPMGGYVDIAGMIDESKGADDLESEPQPWEFRTKPAWQRLIVMLGGIIMNVITGIIIFIGLAYTTGERFIPISEINQYGIYASELGEKVGLETGDKIVNLSGEDAKQFRDLVDPNFLLEENSYITVLRDNKKVRIDIPKEMIEWMSEDKFKKMSYVYPRDPFYVKRVLPATPADKGGLKADDVPIAINGKDLPYFNEFRKELEIQSGKQIELTVLRNDQPLKLQIRVSDEGTLGFEMRSRLKAEYKNYSFLEAIPVGAQEAFNVITVQIKAFGKLFRGEVSASKSVSSPIGIAEVYGGTWHWIQFWTITGMLSMVLAFMNLLPIPALDGGHVVFLTYEIITGRKPSEKVLMVAQQIGMLILLSIMVFAFGNDIFKLISR
ncbi:RIP metalloprotease RseP [Flammeovirga pectinis]|uniref:Zinc metalloprotease n=1 Tax=Flammeovirga pectinis TaxID=2494373 RepID=A0A3Q9FRA9_9BACT|nr:RIP metalloprotease RseP [Flammeovirga pectinis]AZQ64235.1 RIP metalloprotease RseP [Flammeovirga pectinis]